MEFDLKKLSYKLNKDEYFNYIHSLKSDPLIISFNINKKDYFFNYLIEIQKENILINKSQVELDMLFNSFDEFIKNQIIKELIIDEIKQTNEIENIITTHKDLYSSLEKIKTRKNNKKLSTIIEGYKYLLTNKITIKNNQDIKSIYDKVFISSISKKDYPDGKYYRNNMVFISNGLETIHKGDLNENEIIKDMEAFFKIYNSSDIDTYIKCFISHFIFETIHPYYDCNGRFGRLLMSIKIKEELESVTSLLISSSINKNKSKYYKLLESSRNAFQHGFLNNYVYNMLKITNEEINKKIKEYSNKFEYLKRKIIEINNSTSYSKGNKKIMILLLKASLFTQYGLTNDELAEYTNLNKRTIILFINKLIKENKIINTNIGRYTFHNLINDFK